MGREAMGFNASFLEVTFVAAAGGTLYQSKMPETKGQEQKQGEQPPPASAG